MATSQNKAASTPSSNISSSTSAITRNGSAPTAIGLRVVGYKTRLFFSLIFFGTFGSFGLLYLMNNDSNTELQQYWSVFKDTVESMDLDMPSVLINRIGAVTTLGGNSQAQATKADDTNQRLEVKRKYMVARRNATITANLNNNHTGPIILPTKHITRSNVNVTKYLRPSTAVRDFAKENTASNSNDQQQQTEQEKSQANGNPNKLNVVLFYADDWTMKVLGKYNHNVLTPNIDKLADNGMLFSNNCVTTSVCWISRASLVTGAYYARHRQNFPHANGIFESLPWNQTLFPKMKQDGGYFTGLMGKWHAPGPDREMKEAFSMRRFYYGAHWYGNQHVTDMNREHAITFLKERPTHMPFFLKVSFFATHARDGSYPSFEPMNQTRWTHYPDSKYIAPPKTATDAHWEALPSFFERSEGRTRWKRRFEPDYFQDNVKDLYSMATEVDWAVGEVIKELKDQGVYNNTMVIFTTDNGNLQGEHGLTEKWYPFEESLRVPLVIYDPRMPKEKRGTVSHDWTLNIDLAPTILAAAGLEQSSFMQGRDLSQLYLDQKDDTSPSWRKDFFYEFNMGESNNGTDHPWKNWLDASFALVTDEWKYVYWPQQDYEQLFHRSVDPYDEWDLLHKLEKHADAPYDAIQTTDEIYKTMKERYALLKDQAQSGQRM